MAMKPNPGYTVTVRFDGLNWQAELWTHGRCVNMKYVTGTDRDDPSAAIEDARVHFGIDNVEVAE